mmetsp:Transcript_20103/g.41862  ORF Transcript_20103/g.41862 Transcript_20103/m.41862 type:complete len:258 (+) Transcript_20103:822-1595(+)
MTALLELLDLPVLLGELVVSSRVLDAVQERVLLALLEGIDDSLLLQMLTPMPHDSVGGRVYESADGTDRRADVVVFHDRLRKVARFLRVSELTLRVEVVEVQEVTTSPDLPEALVELLRKTLLLGAIQEGEASALSEQIGVQDVRVPCTAYGRVLAARQRHDCLGACHGGFLSAGHLCRLRLPTIKDVVAATAANGPIASVRLLLLALGPIGLLVVVVVVLIVVAHVVAAGRGAHAAHNRMGEVRSVALQVSFLAVN